MKNALRAYARWTRRQASTTQCSPALGVLGMIVALAIVCYIYWQLILTTLEITGMALGSAAVLFIVARIVIWRWRRPVSRTEALEAADTPHHDLPGVAWNKSNILADPESVKEISEEADWLASGVELAWTPDGKELMKKEPT